MQLKVKMLTLRKIVPQILGLVCHDRSQGRILPHIHPSVSQEVPEVRLRGQSSPISGSSIRLSIITPHFYEMHRCSSGASASSGYSHIELHRRLFDFRHRDFVLAHMKELVLRLNAKKSVLCPLQKTTILGVAWVSLSIQACRSLARIESILSAVKRIRQGQSLTVKQFQRLLGLMAAASNVIPFRHLYMRPFSLRGNPFCMIQVTRRCLRALVMWKKPWFLSQGPVLGASFRPKMLTTNASLIGWEVILEGRSSQVLWKDRHLS